LIVVAAGGRALLLRQPDSRSIELLLHLGNVVWFTVAGSAGTPLTQRSLPLGNRFLEFPLLKVDIAQMIVNGRVSGNHLERAVKLLLGFLEFVLAIVNPAETVQESAIVGLD